ncbi:hypothetical protein L3X38_041385 [Prunus dulcis]|uniref:Uncharacterized protein n=1 Tax=Prunus dulcis TaxID=3755 RepID=A0AAD4UUU6_PRUDU|nr:hypothetical protein L3X38_041385 [Prunus dulcis]
MCRSASFIRHWSLWRIWEPFAGSASAGRELSSARQGSAEARVRASQIRVAGACRSATLGHGVGQRSSKLAVASAGFASAVMSMA